QPSPKSHPRDARSTRWIRALQLPMKARSQSPVGRIVMLILRLLLIFAALLPLSAHAAWQRATSAHFVVYADADARWLRDYVSELERFDMLARQAFRAGDRAAGARLTVFVLNSPGEVRAVHGKGQNVGGFYVPGPGGAMAVVP